LLEINVGSVSVSRCRPYVYLGFSCAEHIVYVGQTLDKRGFLGRWTDHLARRDRSSFFCRLAEHDEDAFDRITDLRVLAWDLGDNRPFATIETSHREAVEYLVQKELWGFCGELDPWLRPISKVRASAAVERDFVRDKAAEIVTEFRSYYKDLEASDPRRGT
jgi:hypothetical protein